METVVLVIIGLIVIGIIVRQVVKASQGKCCSGCEPAKKDSGCPECRAVNLKNSGSKEIHEHSKPIMKLWSNKTDTSGRVR